MRLSNKMVSLDLAPFSKKVENHWFKLFEFQGDMSPQLLQKGEHMDTLSFVPHDIL